MADLCLTIASAYRFPSNTDSSTSSAKGLAKRAKEDGSHVLGGLRPAIARKIGNRLPCKLFLTEFHPRYLAICSGSEGNPCRKDREQASCAPMNGRAHCCHLGLPCGLCRGALATGCMCVGLGLWMRALGANPTTQCGKAKAFVPLQILKAVTKSVTVLRNA